MSGGGFRRWARIFRANARGEIDDELSFHLEQLIRDNMAGGMSAAEARAAAERRLGNLAGVRAECAELLTREQRTAARRQWLKFSLLDFKLGLRMLRKYPGMTVVGGAAIAFAIAIGAVAFEFLMQVARPSIDLPDGDRLVALQLWDAEQSAAESRVLHDFAVWRNGLQSIEDVAAYRTAARNLVGPDGTVASVKTAQMTASGFAAAGVTPILGRYLIAADEAAGAADVVVIGERVWRRHLGGNPGIMGRTVQLDGEPHVVVGVMPESFGFPLHHAAWIPLRVGPAVQPELTGPAVTVIGRLASGATMDQARAELAAVAARTRQDSPHTHEHLVARVVPFAETWVEPDALFLAYFGNSFMLVFLLLVYANVALLMFGRAATRDGEIVVRGALGASRGRILMQLFTEALVLGALGAVIGIAIARLGLSWGFRLIEENGVDMPFWFHEGLSPVTLIYTVGLTVLAAVAAGVLPGLRVTRGLGSQLRAAAVGAGGLRFGRGWSAVIIAQIAFTAAFFPLLIGVGSHARNARTADIGIQVEEYLTAELEFSADGAPAARTSEAALLDLKQRLEAEPGVRAVTFSTQTPGWYQLESAIEVEGMPTVTATGVALKTQQATVDEDFFDALGARISAGRNFRSADIDGDVSVVIVNESFVRDVLGGSNPIGRRMRYLATTADGSVQPGPWHEIVGVTSATSINPDRMSDAGVYHPLSLDRATYLSVTLHVDGEPAAFTSRLRTVAAAVDPTLRLEDVQSLDTVVRSYLDAVTTMLRVMMGVGGIALVLALAGIYSIVSFTVARRTREIGIRMALGSGRHRVIAAMFSRSLFQVASGIAIGMVLFIAAMSRAAAEASSLHWWDNVLFIIAYVVLLAGVCLLACVVPARRALAVQPTEALKADA